MSNSNVPKLPIAAVTQARLHLQANGNLNDLEDNIKNSKGVKRILLKAGIIVNKGLAASTAISSRGYQGKVPLPIYNNRLEICNNCEYIKKRSDGLLRCNKCNCGNWRYSSLDGVNGKLWNPAIACMVGKWNAGCYNRQHNKFYELLSKIHKTDRYKWVLVWESEKI